KNSIKLKMEIGVVLLLSILIVTILNEADAKSLPKEELKSDNGAKEAYLKSHGELMKSFMNFSVPPCDDFYEYACGNWPNVKPNRYYAGKMGSLSALIYALNNATEQLLGLNKLAATLNVSTELHVAQKLHNACLAAELYPFPAADPEYLDLIRSIGGFPAVDGEKWNASTFSWFNMSAHLTNYGASGLINDELSPKYPFEPEFKLPKLGFDFTVYTENLESNSSRSKQLNEDRMRSYLRAYQLSEENITKTISGVFAFWTDVLTVVDEFHKDELNCDIMSHILGIPRFTQWSSYYDIAWKGANVTQKHFCHLYYVKLDEICAKHAGAVANYLAMKLLYALDAKLKDPKHQRDYCALKTSSSMGYLLDKLYMKEFFSEEKRSEVSKIVQEIRKSLRLTLEEAEWLDTETRKEALLKESAIQANIGYVEDEALTDRIMRQIGSLEIDESSYAVTNINVQRLHTSNERFSSRHFKELSNDTKPQILLVGMKPIAAYTILDNSINMLAGMLDSPVYHPFWPDALKYGTLGFVLGHELTHGFDTFGSLFDGNGKQRSWWSALSQEKFEKKAECFVDQYSKYEIPLVNQRIDGKKTMDENIADNGGIREAYSAYIRHRTQKMDDHDQDKDETLPGLDLSPEQLFFLGLAQFFCTDFQEELYWNTLTDIHTTDKFRVLGAIANNNDFAKAYNCPPRQNSKVCSLW
ncbi:hypothetical protein KR026_008111, partial [Drosophila bipectinata]